MPWILNDPPPKFEAELANCQRYQLPILQWQQYSVTGRTDNTISIIIPTPVTLCKTPRITDNFAVLDRTTGTTHYGFVPASNSPSPGFIQVLLRKEAHGLRDAIDVFCTNSGVMIDANL